MRRMVRVLNMGAGVQTTAILLEFWDRYKDGYVIFADTGDEKPETYWYIENYLKPFCESKNLKWITVKAKETLMEHCMDRKLFPIVTRRWCTEDFKIKPILRFLRKELKATKKNPVISDIGISLDESHRANFTNSVKYQILEYPLLDKKITREQCKKIILSHGFPLPPKSGCDFCPYQKRKDFRALWKSNPERFKQIVAMEENAVTSTSKGYYLNKNIPLRSIMDNTSIEDFIDDVDMTDTTCDSGHCFV